jgi:glycosyltransferase involved in cell wall biosynthesis
MRLLIIHQNLPGQYKHLLLFYGSQPGTQVVGLGEMRRLKENIGQPIPGVRLVGYEVPTDPPIGYGLLSPTEAAVRRGQAVLGSLLALKKAGFYPDVVYAHPGWGETLFLKDVFPNARLIHFCEFYYHTAGQDFNFDPEYPSAAEDVLKLRTRNLHHLMALEQADLGIAPTFWQKSRFPEAYASKISVVHDGVDTAAVAPDPEAFIRFPGRDLVLRRQDEVVTFVSRNLEPYRGFHTFMRAVPKILKERPNARIIVVGGDGVSYGRRLSQGTYKERYLAEIEGKYDLSRVHFVGKISYETFLRVLQISSAHIYLTYPFVLSWSMMEAMSAGCVVIGSRTAPVEEVIRHGDNGLLVDFFSSEELANAVAEALGDPVRMLQIRQRARQTIVDRYDLHGVCLPHQRKLIESPLSVPVARAGT